MVKVVKYEVVVKVTKKDQNVELKRLFRKLRNAREFVAQTVKGLECTDYEQKGDELFRECKGSGTTVSVRIVKHSLKKYEVLLKAPNGEEKVVAPTLSEAMSVVSEKAKQLGLECKEPTINNGVRTVECSKGDTKMTAEIRVQRSALPKEETFARKKRTKAASLQEGQKK
ncbi:MAG: hypothetical protein ACP5HQ_00830 [Thermoprotei archaeon]